MEETGLIVALGEWVQRQACRQGRAWLDAGLEPGLLAVNLSNVEVRRGRVEERLQQILADTGFPAERLELEITESGLMEQGQRAEEFLRTLRGLGVRLAIDDFGTGYSSLAYLKRFPVHKLKIDRSFIRDIPEDQNDMQLAATIIAMARNFGMTVLAEGVETEAQLDFLRREGCDAYQGFLFSPPLPAQVFEARFLRSAQPAQAR
jgi:EAL domain-containing protein (putative c-di-GMP-specific phosphodiesterase class I)